jgi:hypothetical protein
VIHVAFWTFVGAIIGREIGLLPTYEGLRLSLFLPNGLGHVEISEALRAISQVVGTAAGAIVGSITGAVVARPENITVLHPQRLAVLVSSIGGMLSAFLPLLGPASAFRFGHGEDGWIILALFTPAMVLVFVGNKREPLHIGARIGITIPAGLAILLGQYYRIHHFDGRAVYLLIAASASLVLAPWLLTKTPNRSLTS